MKRFILGLIALLMLTFVGTTFTSCYNNRGKKSNVSEIWYDRADSIDFVKRLQATLPVVKAEVKFEDVIDVMVYREQKFKEMETEDIFLSLDDQTISNICSVLFSYTGKKDTRITPKDIVSHYLQYQKVYDGLPKDTEEIEEFAACPPREQKNNSII